MAVLLCSIPLVGANSGPNVAHTTASVSTSHDALTHPSGHDQRRKKHKKHKHKKKAKQVKSRPRKGRPTSSAGSLPTTTSPVIASVPVAAVMASGAAKPAAGFLGPNSVFRTDVSRAPLNADSAGIVANLANQVTSHWNGVAAFNGWSYNTSFFAAAAATPRVDVKFYDCQNKGYTPSQLHNAQHTGAFDSVPIPANAVAAAGSDKELSIWSPSSDQLWEFWVAEKRSDGWYACWGGRIDHWSTSTGVFSGGTGSSATGIALAAGDIGLSEMQSGAIDHALSLTVVDAESWNLFSYPAQRSDGWNPDNAPHAIREGMRFRLDPTIDVDSLDLTPIAKAVARAAQKYGFIVVDKGGAVALTGESGAGVQAATGIDPWQALTRGVASYNVLKNFPWSRLQALPFDYGKP